MSDAIPAYSPDQLAPETQAIFTQSEVEARSFEHNYIGTEHLLLALLAGPENIGTQVLHTFGVTVERVRKALDYIDRQRGKQNDPPTEQAIGLTPRAKAAITLAVSEAASIRQTLITPELLLIGILREGEGLGAGILRSLGVDLEKVRAQIYAFLVSREKIVSSPKGNVITCRIGDRDIDAIDALVEAGVRSTRSEAAAWLIHAGIDANKTLFETVYGTVAEIRRLRVVAQSLARDAAPSPDAAI
jgi:ATP-dependent Clp protease ATP-binding subunit ClpA